MKHLLICICLLTTLLTARGQQSDGSAADTAAAEPTIETPDELTAPSDDLDCDALWDRGNTAYLRSDYRCAIRDYEAILNRGFRSAKLYYNLGNACFKDDRLGEAILNYRRARLLAPGDEDIRYNLSVAESRTKDRIETIPEFFFEGWMRTLRNLLSGTAWTMLSLVLLALAFLCALFYLLAGRLSLRKGGFYGMTACLALFVVATLFAAADRSETLDRRDAVVMSSAVSVKSSPDRAATDLFVLHEGTVLRTGDSLGDWTEVTIADGRKGWLESRHIETI